MQTKKGYPFIAFALLVVMLLAACSTGTTPQPEAQPATEAVATEEQAAAPADDKISIAYINKMGDNPWFVDEVAGAQAKADELGVEFFNQDVQFDSNLAMTAMDTYIAKGVDAIVIVVPDTKIGPAVIEKAQKAGIPIVAVDDTILDASGIAAPFVGFDAGSAGLKVGELIAEFYTTEGWADNADMVLKAVSVEDQDLEVCNLRTDNAANKLIELGTITADQIIHLPYDNTANSGMDAMAPVITANPDVTHWLLFSCNDDGVLGAWRALQNDGVSADNVIGVGINGQLAAEEFKKGEPTGLRASLMAQAKGHGATSIQEIYDFLTQGTPIPDITFIDAAVMTPENWQELTGQEAETAAEEKPAVDMDISIAYINKMGDNPWFVDEVAGAQAKADELGVEFFNQDVQFDSNLAMTAMDTYIAKGVDAIVIVVPDTKIGPAVIEKAQKAGIPIVAVDDTILDASGIAAPFVGFDAGSAGLKVGELIAEFYTTEGWADNADMVLKAVSVEDQDLEVCNLRTDNAANKLIELGTITADQIIHLPYDNTANSGMDAMAPVITANPDVTHWLLFSCNDDGVLGAWRALQNDGVSADNVIGVGINGQLAAEEFKKGEPTGLRASLMAQAKGHGATSIQEIYDFLTQGTPIPDITFIDAAVMTPENWQELTGQE